MTNSRYEPITSVQERLFVWGLVDSIEVGDGGNGTEHRVFSIDAMVASDRTKFFKLTPSQPKCIRRIVVDFRETQGLPSTWSNLFRRGIEGRWVRLRVAATGGGPRCELEGPYQVLTERDGDGDGARINGGALLRQARLRWGRLATAAEERRLQLACSVDPAAGAPRPARTCLGGIPSRIRIVDAGQAHCAELYDNTTPGKVLGYFDVGKPLSFAAASWPKPPPVLSIPEEGYVVLSHWDYDHYSMAITFAPALLALEWTAPVPVGTGPTVRALVTKLGAALNYVSGASATPRPGLTLHRGLGAASDRNNSGYALRITLSLGDVLLAGDVDYSYLPLAALSELKGVLVPHHGGKIVGPPPAPLGGTGRAVLSFGWPNKYSHPDSSAMASHIAAGWSLVATNWTAHAALSPLTGTSTVTRGDFWF